MKKVYIVSSSFPYLKGEEFLEEESRIWGRFSDRVEVVFCPLNTGGEPRPVPESVIVRDIFRKKKTDIAFTLLKTVFSTLFLRELKNCRGRNRLAKMRAALADSYNALFISSRLARDLKGDEILYSYWFVKTAYAAVLLKKKFPGLKVITRAHRADVYEELRRNSYMPLKQQLINQFDEIHCVCRDGHDYLINRFKADPAIMKISHLGVGESNHINEKPDSVHILSCSLLKPVKNVDRIIDAVTDFARNSDNPVKWTHIGSGDLLEPLKEYADKKMNPVSNLEYSFLGSLSNPEVLEYYRSHSVSCFINGSASEGVPVSLMEAVSFGIPVIGPDVGGISEVVNDRSGILIAADYEISEMAAAINELCKWPQERREQIKAFWKESFNSETNYTSFISSLING